MTFTVAAFQPPNAVATITTAAAAAFLSYVPSSVLHKVLLFDNNDSVSLTAAATTAVLSSLSPTTTTTTATTTFVSTSATVVTTAVAVAPILFAYIVGANTFYLARRSQLRQMSLQEIWKIRTTREEGVSPSLFCTLIIVWQLFVLIFPIAESIATIFFDYTSFFYSYPNASGCGIILEPLNVQHLQASKRSKEQIRLDWHRFTVNIGKVGRDGYRHPPSITRNLPHLDIPKRRMKHWPWRRKESILLQNNEWGGGKD